MFTMSIGETSPDQPSKPFIPQRTVEPQRVIPPDEVGRHKLTIRGQVASAFPTSIHPPKSPPGDMLPLRVSNPRPLPYRPTSVAMEQPHTPETPPRVSMANILGCKQ